MPSPFKTFIHHTLIEVSSQIEEGLPLVPTHMMNTIIKSVLGMAQALYPAKPVSFCFSENRLKMALMVDDPQLVPNFVGYVKQEIAHRLNSLLGRHKRTVWARGYRSTPVLSSDEALRLIVECMSFPMLEDQIADMDEYPALSSWGMIKDKTYAFEYQEIARDEVPKLKNPHKAWREDKEVMQHFERLEAPLGSFELCPYEWKLCFDDTMALPDEVIREKLLAEMDQTLKAVVERRAREKSQVLHTHDSMVRQDMLRSFSPESQARRVDCITSAPGTEAQFERFISIITREAKAVSLRRSAYDYACRYPPGIFPPGGRPVGDHVPKAWTMF